MSPLQIEILLHYHSRAADYRSGDFSAPAVREAIDWFLSEHMLAREDDSSRAGSRSLRTTARAEAWIQYVMTLPLPEQTWAIRERAC